MRLVTRPDLDGLTCAVLLSHCETIDSVELVHPQDVTDRRLSIYEHYAPAHPELARHSALVAETDRLDSAQLTLNDVVTPSGYILVGLTLDPRTSLGGPREYFDLLLPAVRDRPVEEVVSRRERPACMREQDHAFREAALAHSRLHGQVVVTDFRPLDAIPVGNRFLVFTLFPQATVGVRVAEIVSTLERNG